MVGFERCAVCKKIVAEQDIGLHFDTYHPGYKTPRVTNPKTHAEILKDIQRKKWLGYKNNPYRRYLQ